MIDDRYGGWKQTYSGKIFWPLDPRPEEVDAGDIAHALALTCRFGGHCRVFYSVAQHSVLVAHEAMRLCADEDRKHAVGITGLLHDAAEAYVGDMVAPLKRARELEAYVRIERTILDAIYLAFEVPTALLCDCDDCDGAYALVGAADRAMLSTEARDLLGPMPRPWKDMPPPLPQPIVPWSPERAEEEFLRMLWHLMPGGKFAALEGQS